MKYRHLGKSGLQLSELSFGAWVTFGQQISDKTAEELMTIAYDSGSNFFDNAEAYAEGRAEIVMGNILKKKGWPRDTFVVSSKVFWGGDRPNQEGLSRKHVIEACHAALRRLQVDYLDLYFCHRADPNTPIEETVRAMSDLIAQGKVLSWGTSEWSAAAILRRTPSQGNYIWFRQPWSNRNTTCLSATRWSASFCRSTKKLDSAQRFGHPLPPVCLPGSTTKVTRGTPGLPCRCTPGYASSLRVTRFAGGSRK